jgi:hypothetical protein
MEQENSNTTQPQATNNAGVDLKKLPKGAIAIVIICAVGTLGVFLPWYKYVNPFGFFGGYYSGLNAFANVFGISTFWGWLTFLSFGSAAAYALFGPKIKLPEGLSKNALLLTGGSALFFTSLQLLFVLISSYRSPSFGIFVSLLAGIALLLVGLKVIKLT